MNGLLDFTGRHWIVRFLTEDENSFKIIKSLELIYDDGYNKLKANNQLKIHSKVIFEIIRYCPDHNCEVNRQSPCTLDCAYTEKLMAKLILEPKKCSHSYSKAMNQSYPRKCIHCGEPEPINELAYGYAIDFNEPKYSAADLLDAFNAGIAAVTEVDDTKNNIKFNEFLTDKKNKLFS